MPDGPEGVKERKQDVNKALRTKLESYSVQAEAIDTPRGQATFAAVKDQDADHTAGHKVEDSKASQQPAAATDRTVHSAAQRQD